MSLYTQEEAEDMKSHAADCISELMNALIESRQLSMDQTTGKVMVELAKESHQLLVEDTTISHIITLEDASVVEVFHNATSIGLLLEIDECYLK
jgi:adenylate cyclase